MDFLINLDVDDLEHAIAFYHEAFGFTLGRRFGTDGAELLGGPAPLYLLAKAAGTPAFAGDGRHRDYRRHWTPVHLDLVVEEIEPAVERALAAGAVLEAPIATQAWGRLALMADPFGHGFCLVQFLGEGYDAIATS
ncbi:VOC family protein [Halomonas sp. H5]|uniref:VOC family protein n=1 Tax=Halomonas sp. H5 TaxID=3423910 RepID=UPI003D36382F